MPNSTRFQWDAVTKRYRDTQTGKFVSQSDVRTALDTALRNTEASIKSLAAQLSTNEISLTTWEFNMRQAVKDIHLFSMAIARGGWANMTQSDYGTVGSIVKRQYAYLSRFAGEIAAGLPFNGTYVNRAAMYAEAGRHTFYEAQDEEMIDSGYDEESNVLTVAEHCEGEGSCVEQTGRGWVKIGDLIPIGERKCLVRCKCRKRYRNSSTDANKSVLV